MNGLRRLLATVLLVVCTHPAWADMSCTDNPTPRCLIALAEQTVPEIEEYDRRTFRAGVIAERWMLIGEIDRGIRHLEEWGRKGAWVEPVIADAARTAAWLGDETTARALLARIQDDTDEHIRRRVQEVEAMFSGRWRPPDYVPPPETLLDAIAKAMVHGGPEEARRTVEQEAARSAKFVDTFLRQVSGTDRGPWSGEPFLLGKDLFSLQEIAMAQIFLGIQGVEETLSRIERLDLVQAKIFFQMAHAPLCIGEIEQCHRSYLRAELELRLFRALAADRDGFLGAAMAASGDSGEQLVTLEYLLDWQVALGDAEAVRRVLNAIVRWLDDGHWGSLLRVVGILQRAGRPDEAVRLVARIVPAWTKASRPSASARQVMADALFATGRLEAAWQMAIADPDEEPYLVPEMVEAMVRNDSAGRALRQVLRLTDANDRARWLGSIALYLIKVERSR